MHYRTNRTNLGHSKDTGAYLLEFAIALPLFLIFILAAFDIAKVLQAHSSLRQSVNAALRCLYPTDGDCANVPTQEISRNYNWEYRNTKLAEKFVQYQGKAAWLSAPTKQYRTEARVLDHATYTDAGKAITAKAAVYANYVEKKVVTVITPEISGEPGRAYIDKGERYGERSLPGTLEISNSGSNPTGNATFKVPDKLSGLISANDIECKVEGKNRWGLQKRCDHLPEFTKDEAGKDVVKLSVAILIKGSSRGTSIDGRGHLKIAIREKEDLVVEPKVKKNKKIVSIVNSVGEKVEESGDGFESLGGMRIDGPSEVRNFYPRAAPQKWFIDDSWKSAKEYRLYTEYKIALGREYEIKFLMDRDSDSTGTVSWTPDSIQIFVPKYLLETKRFPCKRISDSKEPLNCSKDCEVEIPYIQHNGRAIVETKRVDRVAQPITKSFACTTIETPSPLDLLDNESLQELEKLRTYCDFSLTTTEACPIGAEKVVACPADNKGVERDRESDSKALVQACPLPEGAYVDGAQFSFRTEELHSEPWEDSKCQAKIPPVPSEWSSYKNIGAPTIIATGARAIRTPAATIEELEEVYKAKQCTGLTLERKNSFSRCEPQPDKEPVFGVEHPVYLTKPGYSDEQLRAAAFSCGVPQGATFDKFQRNYSMREREGEPQPDVQYKVIAAGDWHKVGGVFKEGEVPDLCKKGRVECRKILAPSNTEYAPLPNPLNYTKAKQIAQDALHALYPRAQFNCADNAKGEFCVSFQEGATKSDGAEPVTPHLAATMRVPLLTTSIFGTDAVNISYTGERSSEAAAIKNSRNP